MWPFIAVGVGGAIGSILRWRISAWLNQPHAWLPWGTLTVNWLGGFLIGILVAFFAHNPYLSSPWKLFLITGIMGGLTTFSTFTSESVGMLQNGAYFTFVSQVCLHLVGSIVLCMVGMALYKAVFQ